MTLAELVAITGMPGLYKVTGKRNDGLIVTSLTDNKTTFVSGRTHMFSTLDNITMFTTGDGVTLKEVLASIKKLEAENPTSSVKDDASLKAFVAKAIPDYDREKVYVSDMKKLVKWYDILNSKNLIEELTADEEVAKKEEAATEEAPAKKETKKEAKADAAKPKKEAKPKTESKVKAAPKAAPVKKITTPRKAS
jgi:hypothetical protein